MNNRTKALSALASVGVIAAGWGVATANGNTLASAEAPTGAVPTPGSTAGSAGSASTGQTAGAASGTFTGTAASHRYGSVQVTATIENGTITGLTEKVSSDGDRKSNQINARAIPTLRASLIGSNGSGASTVSGATYTTRAYLTSLQSALDQTGVPTSRSGAASDEYED